MENELRQKDVPFLIRQLLSTKEIKAEHEEDLQDPRLSQYKREYDVAERRQIRDIWLERPPIYSTKDISLILRDPIQRPWPPCTLKT